MLACPSPDHIKDYRVGVGAAGLSLGVGRTWLTPKLAPPRAQSARREWTKDARARRWEGPDARVAAAPDKGRG